jgi:hypothetical protein
MAPCPRTDRPTPVTPVRLVASVTVRYVRYVRYTLSYTRSVAFLVGPWAPLGPFLFFIFPLPPRPI